MTGRRAGTLAARAPRHLLVAGLSTSVPVAPVIVIGIRTIVVRSIIVVVVSRVIAIIIIPMIAISRIISIVPVARIIVIIIPPVIGGVMYQRGPSQGPSVKACQTGAWGCRG